MRHEPIAYERICAAVRQGACSDYVDARTFAISPKISLEQATKLDREAEKSGIREIQGLPIHPILRIAEFAVTELKTEILVAQEQAS